MTKLFFVLQNSIKNLFRTSGILVSFFMVCLSSFLSYSFLNISQFFSHMHTYTIEDAFQLGSMGFFDLISPAGVLTTFLKISSLLIAFIFIFSTVSALRRLFFQIAKDQWNSLKIMSLLGEKNEIISFEFSLQSIYTSALSLVLGLFAADLITKKSLFDSLKFGPMGKIVSSFQVSHEPHIFIILFSCLYVGGHVFFFVRKQLISFFDNSKAMQ